VRFLI